MVKNLPRGARWVNGGVNVAENLLAGADRFS